MPKTGVYFPFLSYRGSLMIAHMALIGLVLQQRVTLNLENRGHSKQRGFAPSHFPDLARQSLVGKVANAREFRIKIGLLLAVTLLAGFP